VVRVLSKVIFWIGVVMLVGAAAAPPARPFVSPHPQVNLPPLQLPKFQLTRSQDEVRAIYKFAAERPDVLHYIPCFCGCDRLGHTSNEDCFVKTRAANGDVTAWNDHGMMCPMCLAIGDRAKQMTEAGIPVSRIRADIDKTYNHTGVETPTPEPPKSKTTQPKTRPGGSF
jgi:hypothetical protein